MHKRATLLSLPVFLAACLILCLNIDRLTLYFLCFYLFILHRTEDIKENVLAVSVIILVSLLGFVTLSRGFCRDLWVLLFCLVMASCQYSLLKARPPLVLTSLVCP